MVSSEVCARLIEDFKGKGKGKLRKDVGRAGDRTCLEVYLHDVTVLHHIVALHHHPVVYGPAPYAGILELGQEVLVDSSCQVLEGRVPGMTKGSSMSGSLPGFLE